MSNFKSGFVTIIGKSNVGKSSLTNRIIGEKVSAVVNKKQTTRKNAKAILNRPNSQIVFIDTPGIFESKTLLDKTMNKSAISSIEDVDLIVYMIDTTDKNIDQKTINIIKESNKKTILAINKIDLISKEKLAELIDTYNKLYDFTSIVPISIKKDENIDELLDEIERNLEEGPAYYDVEEYTDQTLRELSEEVIREKALKLLRDEVPHGIYVETTKMKSRKTKLNEKIFDIESTIYCIRESHKGIIIGKNGSMLKKIGTYAREALEKMLNSKVNLKLWVKVNKDWMNDSNIVKKFKANDK